MKEPLSTSGDYQLRFWRRATAISRRAERQFVMISGPINKVGNHVETIGT